MAHWFVVVMGIATVFTVLILLIALCYLLGLLGKAGAKKEEPVQNTTPVAPAAIPNRAELSAAITAAISEYSGSDMSAIRILSIKKI